MKRVLLILLAALLLAGCSQNSIPDTTVTQGTEPTNLEATEPGLYQPDSLLEQRTKGAVRVYSLPEKDYTGMTFMGEDILLFREDRLELLSGETLRPTVSVSRKDLPTPDAIYQAFAQGMAYYDPQERSVVILEDTLYETSRLHMPEDMVGTPYISRDGQTVYYCTEHAVRALDIQSGIPRLIRQENVVYQTIIGGLFEDQNLLCIVETADGKSMNRLISAQTGETIFQDDSLAGMKTGGQNYFLKLFADEKEHMIFGSREEPAQVLTSTEGSDRTAFVPLLNGAVGQTAAMNGMLLTFYDLSSGKQTEEVILEGIQSVLEIQADPAERAIWLRCQDMTENQLLLRWELGKNQSNNEKIYTDLYYSRENPDTEGLAQCQTQADALSQKYGIQIILGEEAGNTLKEDCSFQTEYLVVPYQTALNTLEQVLPKFPQDFFVKAAKQTPTGKLQILLLRQISHTSPAHGGGTKGIQYWEEGDIYIALQMDKDLEQNFYHQIAHVIDNRVFSLCTAYDNWNRLNPYGFAYDNDYVANLNRTENAYLHGAYRAFVSTFSMSYALEDRATILEYACMPGQEAVFASATMQQKLKTVCTGIRQAFDLEDGEQFWEQYLQ